MLHGCYKHSNATSVIKLFVVGKNICWTNVYYVTVVKHMYI